MVYELYPAVDENFDFPPEIRAALAKSLDLRNSVLPMTQVQRNNLAGPELWDGRTVVNTTTDRINRYDAGTATWVEIPDQSDVLSTANASALALLDTTGTPVMEGTAARGVAVKAARADHVHPKFLNGARMFASSAGAQWDAGANQWYYSLGLSFSTVFVLRMYTLDAWSNMIPNEAGLKAITPGNGTVYFNNDGNTSNGFVRLFRGVELA